MFVTTLICVCALAALAAGELSAGIYRVRNRYYYSSLAAQIGNNIQTVGGQPSDDVRVTWFVAPAPGHVPDAYTIQNVHSQQYLSVDGAPANGSVLVPSNLPFVWTYTARGELAAGGLSVATLTFRTLVLLPPGTDKSQDWAIEGVQPFAATYRVWHPLTDTYLSGPAELPGRVTAAHLDPHDALQYWIVAGTSAASRTGSLANVPTGGFLSIANDTVGAFSATQPTGWLFTVVGGGARLTSGGNALAVNLHGRVVAEPPDVHSALQVFVFVPAAPATPA